MVAVRQGGVTHIVSIVQASGFGLFEGKIQIPTSVLSFLLNKALASIPSIERCELVPAEGSAYLHLIVHALKYQARVTLHCTIESVSISEHEAKLSIRWIETPIVTSRQGQPLTGPLGALSLLGKRALQAFGTSGILQTMTQKLGEAISLQDNIVTVHLSKIPQVQKILLYTTPLGPLHSVLHITNAQFQPEGLTVFVTIQLRSALRTVFKNIRAYIILIPC